MPKYYARRQETRPCCTLEAAPGERMCTCQMSSQPIAACAPLLGMKWSENWISSETRRILCLTVTASKSEGNLGDRMSRARTLQDFVAFKVLLSHVSIPACPLVQIHHASLHSASLTGSRVHKSQLYHRPPKCTGPFVTIINIRKRQVRMSSAHFHGVCMQDHNPQGTRAISFRRLSEVCILFL